MINLETIKQANSNIKQFINETTLLYSEYFSSLCKGNVYLKLENHQETNSFKIRGALNKIMNLTLAEKAKGIITASSGNHAQAVCYAANLFDISTKIVVPTTTPENKLKKIRNYAVELILYGQNYDETESYTKKLAEEENRIFISGYNDEMIIAGQGTIGLEIFNQLPTVTDVLVPVGGGGLISGIALALKNLKPSIRIIGVQTAACPVFYESLKAGKIISVEMKESIADGMYGGLENDSITFEIVKKYVDDMIIVKEETIKKALSLLWYEDNQKVEGSGAASIASLLEKNSSFIGKNIVAILSGGNIDENLFQYLINVY